MFKYSFAAALMLLSLGGFAQHTLSGRIGESKTNQPLSGASVQLTGSTRSAVSDAFGKFRINGLANGEYTLLVRYLGFADVTQAVSIADANATVVLMMEETAVITDEVVVTATRADDKTPTTFTNIGKDALQRQNFGQDLPFLANWTPSVVTTSDAGTGIGYTGMRIRGSDATRINVTINGIAYNDSESQGTFWVNIPDIASSTQSIQIQRGVGTSTNGAGAFGGSINVQTNSLQTDAYAELSTAAGSFNTQRYTAKTGTGLINNHWTFDARVSKIMSDGYVDRAASDLSSYYISGGYYGKKTIVKAITFGGHEKTYQSWNGNDPETMKTNRTFNSAGALYNDDYSAVIGYYDNEVDDYRQDHYQLHVTQRLNDSWDANVSLHYTYGRGFYEQYKQDKSFADLGLEDVVIENTTIDAGDFILRKWLDNQFYGGTFSFNYEKGKTNLIIGGAFDQYGHAKHFGEIIWAEYAAGSGIRQHYYDGASEKNDFNLYTKWSYDITPALQTFVDLQFRKVDYRTSGIDDDLTVYDLSDSFNFFNPKAGLSYSLSEGSTLYASYAVANREPNRTDYLDGAVKPKRERLNNVEMGWRKRSDKYAFEATYYLMNYTDQLVLTGALDNVGNPIRANIGKSFRTGVELSGIVRFSDKVTWNANITWSANKNRDYPVGEGVVAEKKNTTIVLSPSWIAGSQFSWNAFPNFQATLLSKYVGKQYLDNTGNEELILDGYLINDIRLSYTLAPRIMKGISLSVLANNVLDHKYSSNGAVYGTTPYFYPQAGRNFMVMLTLSF